MPRAPAWSAALTRPNPVDDRPKLVPKSEQKPTADAEGEGGGHGSAEGEAAPKVVGMETPDGHGGDRYASNYYTLEKDFTANLQDSIHIVQVRDRGLDAV